MHFNEIQTFDENKMEENNFSKFENVKIKFLKRLLSKKESKNIFNNFMLEMIQKNESLKFGSYISDNGYPNLFQVKNISVVGKDKFLVINNDDDKYLKNLTIGKKISIFIMNNDFSSFLNQGIVKEKEVKYKLDYIIIEVNKVYNTMLPQIGYVN